MTAFSSNAQPTAPTIGVAAPMAHTSQALATGRGQQNVSQQDVSQFTSDLDPATHVRILVETAMEQSRFSDMNTQLVVRQLAAELVKIRASLSDVRVAVQALYQEDRDGAKAYLAYLEENGFPPSAAPPPGLATQQPRAAEEMSGSSAPREKLGLVAAPHTAFAVAHSDTLATTTKDHTAKLSLYGGNLITELVNNNAYSGLFFGERRSGTSALLRAIAYDQLAKSGKTTLDILDLHNGEWGGLEDIRLEDGSRIVSYHTVCTHADIERVSQQLVSVEAEIRRRQQAQQNQRLALSELASGPYLFLIDGLSELHGALPGWTADRRSKDLAFSRAASSLRFILCHGPAVGVCCVATARSHDLCLCDATALGETKLLFLGRVSGGRNGGYRAIDAAVEDKALLPSSHERSRFRTLLSALKRLATPVVFTPNGVPRLGRLGNFSSYLTVDLLAHYQYALEQIALEGDVRR